MNDSTTPQIITRSIARRSFDEVYLTARGPAGDEPEELDVIPWPISDLVSLTARDDCTEGRSIAALYIARDYLRKDHSKEHSND